MYTRSSMIVFSSLHLKRTAFRIMRSRCRTSVTHCSPSVKQGLDANQTTSRIFFSMRLRIGVQHGRTVLSSYGFPRCYIAAFVLYSISSMFPVSCWFAAKVLPVLLCTLRAHLEDIVMAAFLNPSLYSVIFWCGWCSSFFGNLSPNLLQETQKKNCVFSSCILKRVCQQNL